MALVTSKRPSRQVAADCDQQWVDIGRRIRVARMRRCMTRDELALRSGLNAKSQIDKYENGASAIPIASIVVLAKALGCSSDYLLGLKDETLELIAILEDERLKMGRLYVSKI